MRIDGDVTANRSCIEVARGVDISSTDITGQGIKLDLAAISVGQTLATGRGYIACANVGSSNDRNGTTVAARNI